VIARELETLERRCYEFFPTVIFKNVANRFRFPTLFSKDGFAVLKEFLDQSEVGQIGELVQTAMSRPHNSNCALAAQHSDTAAGGMTPSYSVSSCLSAAASAT